MAVLLFENLGFALLNGVVTYTAPAGVEYYGTQKRIIYRALTVMNLEKITRITPVAPEQPIKALNGKALLIKDSIVSLTLIIGKELQSIMIFI